MAPAWEQLKNQAVGMSPVWQAWVAQYFILGLIGVIAATMINVLGVAFQWIVNTLGVSPSLLLASFLDF